jgi:HD-GYP domain-containing protein (c-di-GMP phosphodiesterase class II)
MLMLQSKRCDHARGHSGRGHLSEQGRLRFALVCDECGAERREVHTVAYNLNAKPYANSLAELTAKELGLAPELVGRVRLASMLCDVATSQIPPAILEKEGPLSTAEWNEVHRHPELGAAMLSGATFDDIRAWILTHHERPDGTGYPRGLRGSEIPLEARILAVVDAYDAMINERPYRPAMSHEQACAELKRNAGTQFDRLVVTAFLGAVELYRRRLAQDKAAAQAA